MTEPLVFVSYKREDETRTAQLVHALKAEGLAVWWDRALPGGEEWRANIEKALAEARCVVVIWTRASVGAEGGFVREEAAHAKARGVLVPVLMEKVRQPLGFAEIQTVDLVGWRGARSDPSFLDLVAAIRAKLEGQPVPRARGPGARIYRRIAAGATLSGVLLAAWGITINALGAQDQICRLPLGQPGLSDLCGDLTLGHSPTRADRLAWAGRPQGNCDVLRSFARDEHSAYRDAATALLSSAVLRRSAAFTPQQRPWRSYVRVSEQPFAAEDAAQADALARASRDAAQQGCAQRDSFERLVSVRVTPVEFDCRIDPRGGHTCGLSYGAVCRIERRDLVQVCR